MRPVADLEGLGQDLDIPICLISDFNCEPEDLPTMMSLIRDESWTDVGAVAAMWGGKDRQPTCMAPNANGLRLGSTSCDDVLSYTSLWLGVAQFYLRIVEPGSCQEHAEPRGQRAQKCRLYRVVTKRRTQIR